MVTLIQVTFCYSITLKGLILKKCTVRVALVYYKEPYPRFSMTKLSLEFCNVSVYTSTYNYKSFKFARAPIILASWCNTTLYANGKKSIDLE